MALIRLATSGGKGAGMFLGRALRDALHGGTLTHVRFEVAQTPGWSCVFIVHFPEGYREEIAAGLDENDRVVTAQTGREPDRGKPAGYRPQAALLEALLAGDSVSRISWLDAMPGREVVSIEFADAGSYAIDLSDFGDTLTAC